MVRTVSPNASATPSRPIPTPGNAAAITALPHPPNTSQKVPLISAASLRMAVPRGFRLGKWLGRVSDIAIGSNPDGGVNPCCVLIVAEMLEAPLPALLRRVGGDRLRLFLLRFARFLVLTHLSLGHRDSPASISLSYSSPPSA